MQLAMSAEGSREVKIAHCSFCGEPLEPRTTAGETRSRLTCIGCNRIHYENPKVLVWCFAYCRDRVLFCRRAIEPAKGCWAPPSGFVELGESLEEAAARETREETGLALDPASLILFKVVSIPHMNQIYVGFRAELAKIPNLTPGPEVIEARFWSQSDLPFHQLAYRDMVKGAPEDFFSCLSTGVFVADSVTIRGSEAHLDMG